MTTLLLLASATVFAESVALPVSKELIQNAAPINSRQAEGTIYFRAVTSSTARSDIDVFPGLGLGYRKSFGHSGLDVSFNFIKGAGWGNTQKLEAWTAPKVTYLYYINANSPSSFYAGTGLAWGGTSYRKTVTILEEDGITQTLSYQTSAFRGLIPNIVLGYEFLRHELVTSFVELTASQPVIPSYSSGLLPRPALELSLGAGF
mgnify:FL=1